jgi:outer membrane biosynthesis protein TonB
VIKSIPALDGAALDCIARWRFNPALKDGKPVAVIAQMPITFLLV